jgi:phosphate transport system substrate-binding protein
VKRGVLWGLILPVVCLSGCAAGTDPAVVLSTSGSTSMEQVMGILTEGFQLEYPEVTVTYEATGSGTGIAAVTEGKTEIGLSSRQLRESETDLETVTIALDGIAVVVSSANPVEDLSCSQLSGLMTGEITNWSQVGGLDQPVTVIGREAGAGTREGFESALGITGECRYDQEINSNGGVVAAVGSNPYAIGYTSLAASEGQDRSKTVTVDGIPCTEETVRQGTYPLQRPFLFVFRADTPLSSAADAFLTFAQSEAGQALIVQAGAVPAEAGKEAAE